MSDLNKRRGFWGLLDMSSAFSSFAAIAVGLVVGFFVLLLSNPANAGIGFVTLLSSGFGDLKSAGQVLYFATPIIMTGLSVAFSARTGLFNIGASGQFIIGAYCSILIGVKCSSLPGWLLCPLAVIAAGLAGALWGAVPGLLKAWRNVNEVIACIMMNYIGMYLVNYLIVKTVYDQRRNITMAVASHANIPTFGLDKIFRLGNSPSSAGGGIFIALLAAVVIYLILEKTTLGYEIKACGFNKNAAEYAGINSSRGIITAMAVSGALAGLGGALLFLSGAGKGIDVVDTLAQEGFNGIPVALLALNNPIGVIFSGLFIAYLTVGGFNMQLYNYAPQAVDMIVAIIIYFSAASLLIKGLFQKLGKRDDKILEKGGDEA
ncbi:MAG: ABC transporter permease [Clostridiales bacterium]|nr:ABC transporter permease [Clostridiales bacterium]